MVLALTDCVTSIDFCTWSKISITTNIPCLFIGCSTFQQYGKCISGPYLFRYFDMLPLWDSLQIELAISASQLIPTPGWQGEHWQVSHYSINVQVTGTTRPPKAGFHPFTEAGIAPWWCVGLTVLLDAASWVRSSSEENCSRRGDFPLGANMGSDSIPPKLFWMRA